MQQKYFRAAYMFNLTIVFLVDYFSDRRLSQTMLTSFCNMLYEKYGVNMYIKETFLWLVRIAHPKSIKCLYLAAPDKSEFPEIGLSFDSGERANKCPLKVVWEKYMYSYYIIRSQFS